MVIGFVGAGNMVAAMARGLHSADPDQRMLFTDSGSGRAAALADQVGGETAADNAELAAATDLLILGCKPKDLDRVAASTQAAEVVISLLGATGLDRLAASFPGARVFRLMPNLGVERNQGVLCLAAGRSADPALKASVVALLEQLGPVFELEDAQIDAATAIMGCSPAYLDLFVDALVASGSADGALPADLARQMVLATLDGSVGLIAAREPGELRRQVASPGGSTEAGLEALAATDFRGSIAAAVEASLARMRGDR